ncbi:MULTISPECIES: Imm58 family immunity protein [Burkholderiaceae]|uniref:Immunity protein 58 n=1 Tax=Burkholderia cepacia TaxID=292 RepID=A0A8I1DRQ3_BURCE|nr:MULTISPECIES: Imm58 family immunity protein [Burkholderiaceae]MBA9899114.1 hypothetical protein [Burkholderia cepacia]MBA9949599.1 hypothetical protein [Burkholderia cepacia]MBA9979093.1 hypothetical protein [Burkholderia cepacia]MBA9997886.1 hypothetical protein [Burkholderia cepacia]MBB0003148.1 hypothetical protein [Burkholderia cepacia]
MRIFLASIILALILMCSLFAYLWIDRAISLGYANQSLSQSNTSLQSLERLLGNSWRGMSKQVLLEKLREEAGAQSDMLIYVEDEGGVVWFGEIRFNIENGRLVNVGH